MKLNMDPAGQNLLLPRRCGELLTDADACDLRLLLYIAACESRSEVFDPAAAAAALGMEESEVRSSVKFWRGAGVLADGAAETGTKEPKSRKPLPEKRKYAFTAEELCAIKEENAGFSGLIDAAQQTAGWIFNRTEIEILAALYTRLNLSAEYILLLIQYYVKEREKPLRYLESAAYDLSDRGVVTVEALEERLRALEAFEGRAGNIRKLFGIGSRTLSAREEGFLTNWFDVYGFDDDVIRLAYEATVNAIGKASLSYANSILAAWHKDGVVTAADVKNRTAKKPVQKKTQNAPQSYDVGAFFDKALERSYKDGEKA